MLVWKPHYNFWELLFPRGIAKTCLPKDWQLWANNKMLKWFFVLGEIFNGPITRQGVCVNETTWSIHFWGWGTSECHHHSQNGTPKCTNAFHWSGMIALGGVEMMLILTSLHLCILLFQGWVFKIPSQEPKCLHPPGESWDTVCLEVNSRGKSPAVIKNKRLHLGVMWLPGSLAIKGPLKDLLWRDLFSPWRGGGVVGVVRCHRMAVGKFTASTSQI